MKKYVLNIKSILGTDIRTRSRIYEIVSRMCPDYEYTLDMSGVELISRSFADEMLSFVDNYSGHLDIVNSSPEIAEMLRIVRLGRNTKLTASNNSEVKELNSMKDVELFFDNL